MINLSFKALVLLVTSVNVAYFPFSKVQLTFTPISLLFPSINSSSNAVISNLAECKPDFAEAISETIDALPQQPFMSCIEEVHQCRENGSHPDLGLTTQEIIASYGYPVEMHNVTTKDGYILTAHRIPNRGSTPVYLQHGLGGCSDTFIYQYRNKSLPFLLWEAGYDVWLGNFRGTTYSLGHVSLYWDNPTNFSYWDFSWHENGIHDVPAFITLILSITRKPKLLYVGYSMGAQSYLVALDQVPEMNDKIEAGFLLAPGGFTGRSTVPLRVLAPLGNIQNDQYLEPKLRGRVDELAKVRNIFGMSQEALCSPTAIRCTACDLVIFALFGLNAPQMNYTIVPNIVGRYPNIMSVKTLYHYAQTMNDCNFAQYDYGTQKNLQIYGAEKPPEYSLKTVRVKTYAFHGRADNVFEPGDVRRTLARLPNGTLVQNTRIQDRFFNHADFMIAKDARDLVYIDVLRLMDRILPARK